MDRRGSFEEALELRKLTRDYKACLVINDHVDIAAAVDADGVHLGQDDLPLAEARKILGKEKIIGISTCSEEEAIKAEVDGADYIGFGPLFHTVTKDIGEPIGPDMLGNIRNKVKIPVVAIGGISKEHLGTVMSHGVQAVAVAAGILKGDIGNNAKGFIQKLQKSS
jgi:thiamine-phosphate pyrophosphorylase